MKLPRRKFLHLAAGATALPALPRMASADTYPSRPVHMIVGFPASNASDIIARLIAQSLSDRLGQQYRHRDGRASGSGRLYASSSRPTSTDQRDALPEPQLQFHP